MAADGRSEKHGGDEAATGRVTSQRRAAASGEDQTRIPFHLVDAVRKIEHELLMLIRAYSVSVDVRDGCGRILRELEGTWPRDAREEQRPPRAAYWEAAREQIPAIAIAELAAAVESIGSGAGSPSPQLRSVVERLEAANADARNPPTHDPVEAARCARRVRDALSNADTELRTLAGTIRTRAEAAAHSLLDEVQSIFHDIEQERQQRSRRETQKQRRSFGALHSETRTDKRTWG